MSQYFKNINKYDWGVFLIIAALSTGTLGGAIQSIRIISILIFPFNFIYIFKHKESKIVVLSFYFSVFWLLYGAALMYISSSNNYLAPFELTYTLLYVNIIYALIRFSKRAKFPLRSLALGWVAAISFTLPIAVWEITTNNHLSLANTLAEKLSRNGFYGLESQRFASATFGNYNEYVNMISVGLPYLFFSLLTEKNKKILFVILAVISVVLLVNASRGGMLCLIIDFLIFFKYTKKYLPSKSRKVIYFFLFVAFLGFLQYSGVLLAQLTQRFSAEDMTHDSSRVHLIMKSLNVLEESGFMGVGPAGVFDAIDFAPHNMWTEILVNYGIFVFTFGFLIMSKVWIQTYRFSRRSVYSFIPIATLVSLPFYICVNSTYMDFSFIWIAIASLFIVHQNIRRVKSFN